MNIGEALAEARRLRSKATRLHQRCARERIKGASKSSIELLQGAAFTFFDQAKEIEVLVGVAVDRFTDSTPNIETREGPAAILRFRQKVLCVRFSDAGEVMISMLTGRVLRGQEAATRAHWADQPAARRDQIKRIFDDAAALITKAEARQFAKTLGMLEIEYDNRPN